MFILKFRYFSGGRVEDGGLSNDDPLLVCNIVVKCGFLVVGILDLLFEMGLVSLEVCFILIVNVLIILLRGIEVGLELF